MVSLIFRRHWVYFMSTSVSNYLIKFKKQTTFNINLSPVQCSNKNILLHTKRQLSIASMGKRLEFCWQICSAGTGEDMERHFSNRLLTLWTNKISCTLQRAKARLQRNACRAAVDFTGASFWLLYVDQLLSLFSPSIM